MRYGPFFAGYWNSLVSLAHGAKHCASELGSDTTLGGAAAATPAASSALRATAQVRYCIWILLWSAIRDSRTGSARTWRRSPTGCPTSSSSREAPAPGHLRIMGTEGWEIQLEIPHAQSNTYRPCSHRTRLTT